MRGKIDRGADSSFPTLDARWHATLHLPLFHILVGKGQGPTKILSKDAPAHGERLPTVPRAE